MLCGVIFDHDGTLVDTEKQHYRIWHQLLQEFGHYLPEQDYVREYSGVPTVDGAARLVQRYRLDITAEHLCHMKEKRVLQWTGVAPLMPGVLDILHYLHERRVPMAVATGARFEEVDRNLRAHSLHGMFRAVCSSSHVERNKPAPDVYLLAAEQLGLTPAQCLAIEDTPTGLRSAVAAGVPCVVIPSARDHSHDFSAAHRVMPHLGAVRQWLYETLDVTEPETC